MADAAEREQADAAWWAEWRAEDYTWPGLAKKAWEGYGVTADGRVVETESGELYRVNSPSALALQAMRWDDEGKLIGPTPAPDPAVILGARSGAQDPGVLESPPVASLDPGLDLRSPQDDGGGSAPKPLRPATLQDYWRCDPATGRLRTDAELIAAGELVFKAQAPIPSPAGEGRASNGEPGVGPSPADSAPMPHPDGGAAAVDPPLSGEGWSGAAGPNDYPPETYHIAHLPLAYADDTPTGKADWPEDALNPILRPRLHAAGQATWEGPSPNRWESPNRKLTSPDRRAQLGGCVLLAFDAEALAPAADGQPRLSLDAKSALFVWHCVCSTTTLVGDSIFTSARFERDARFERATFTGNARFEEATFTGDARFGSAMFAKKVVFAGAKFEGADKTGAINSGRMVFHNAVFADFADFTTVAFARNAAHHAGAFKAARFVDVADFGGAGTHWIAALDEAIFERRVILDQPAERDANRAFARQVLPAILAAGDKETPVETRLQQLEGGCRVAKVAMGTQRNEVLEQRYYRFQLIARRKQKGTPAWEKAMSWLYGGASDYGASFSRPLALIGLNVLAFGLVYWALASTGLADLGGQALAIVRGPLDPEAWAPLAEGLSYSAGRVFPFGPWDDPDPDRALSRVLAQPGTGLGLRALGTLQSLAAILLAFLFALAVRRRFQIS